MFFQSLKNPLKNEKSQLILGQMFDYLLNERHEFKCAVNVNDKTCFSI